MSDTNPTQPLSWIGEAPEDPRRVFQCSECNRAYSRPDHLSRHIRSHTKEKPYRCEICSKGFARGDLLKRHEAAHQRRLEESKLHGNAGHEKISRVGRACKTCSDMHLRCDESKPCERCRRRNIECISLEVDAPQSTNASNDSAGGHYSESTHYHHQGLYAPSNEVAPFAHHVDAGVQQISLEPMTQATFPGVITGLDGFQGGFPYAGDDAWMHRSLFQFGAGEHVYDFQDHDVKGLGIYNQFIPFVFEVPTPPEMYTSEATIAANIQHTASIGHEAYLQTGVWRWRPGTHRQQVGPGDSAKRSQRSLAVLKTRKPEQRIDANSREKVIALVQYHASKEKNHAWERCLESFPNVELLDALIQFYLTKPLAESDLLFHLPTFAIRNARPELVLALVSVGAISTPDETMIKFGMSLQEIVRQSVLEEWDRHSESTRNLELTQAYQVMLVMAFWSGDSRKTELGEAFINALVTMLRRANRFRRYHYNFPAVSPEDVGQVLGQKWKQWISSETWKRIVHHIIIGDAMQSMIFGTPPLISNAEIGLPLPDSQDLWHAPNAETWKRLYLGDWGTNVVRRPSLLECLADTSNLITHAPLVNDRFASMGVVAMIWRRLWDHRQESVLLSLSTPQQNLNHRVEDIRAIMRELRFATDLRQPENVITLLFLETASIHLHIAMEDVQLFAGIEGPDEARRVHPELQEWSLTQSAREAIWHSGQVVLIAKYGPKATLNAIGAVAVYQAALVLWVYGIMSRDTSPTSGSNTTSLSAQIVLDEPETESKRAFIDHSIGRPVIRGLLSHVDQHPSYAAALTDPTHVMDAVIHIFRSNWEGAEPMPVLVANLIKLMTGLRNATERFMQP